MLHDNRDPPAQDEEGAAGREASKPAQQAGAGGPQHLPRPQRPGAAGNPPADRDEAGQVSRSVWTHISSPSANPPSRQTPHPSLPHVCAFHHSTSLLSTLCLLVCFPSTIPITNARCLNTSQWFSMSLLTAKLRKVFLIFMYRDVVEGKPTSTQFTASLFKVQQQKCLETRLNCF